MRVRLSVQCVYGRNKNKNGPLTSINPIRLHLRNHPHSSTHQPDPTICGLSLARTCKKHTQSYMRACMHICVSQTCVSISTHRHILHVMYHRVQTHARSKHIHVYPYTALFRVRFQSLYVYNLDFMSAFPTAASRGWQIQGFVPVGSEGLHAPYLVQSLAPEGQPPKELSTVRVYCVYTESWSSSCWSLHMYLVVGGDDQTSSLRGVSYLIIQSWFCPFMYQWGSFRQAMGIKSLSPRKKNKSPAASPVSLSTRVDPSWCGRSPYTVMLIAFSGNATSAYGWAIFLHERRKRYELFSYWNFSYSKV